MPVRYRLFVLTATLAMAADQLSKLWARSALLPGRPKELFSLWAWDLSYNTGSAFGLFSSASYSRILLSVIGVAAAIAILLILRKRTDQERQLAVALGLVFGGAIGNVVDRVLMGKVTDFISWHVGNTRWPTFNVADVVLVVGVALLFFAMGPDKKKAAKLTTK